MGSPGTNSPIDGGRGAVIPEYRVEVFWKGHLDGRATDLMGQIAHLGIKDVEQLRISSLFFLRGALAPQDLDRLAVELLADPVVEGFHWQRADTHLSPDQPQNVIEVGLLPGVTDPVATHLLHRAQLLDIGPLEAVTTAMRYEFEGDLSIDSLHTIAREILCNEVIQRYTLGSMKPAFVPDAEPDDQVEIVSIRDLDDVALARLSVERVLFLSLDEMRAIQAKFRHLGRDPTDAELETLAQTWSEHCLHKTFKSEISFICRNGMPRFLPDGVQGAATYQETIPGLLKTYVQAVTRRLNREWVRSAFVDNAGIIDFDEEFEISFKVETHNHPSALEPFGGANTGVGGVIRDVIGVSARPIANTDVLCFGPLDTPDSQVPSGALNPRRIARGVVAGIEDYGNKMGIPTVSGAILYDKGYLGNPLVFCGCVGIAPKGMHRRSAGPGDLCVALGGRTGRDGLHGATFSSAELTHTTSQTVGSVVQIGDPITEKAVLEAVMQARDEGLYTAITDCGAGGFSSAAGEMGRDVGVEVDLRDVRLKYPGLRPWEIWLSEAQERMVLAVPKANLPRLREICEILDVEWTVIGRFTGDKRLRVHYGDKIVADMDMAFVHEGRPKSKLDAVWEMPELPEPDIDEKVDQTSILLQMLAHPDVASKEQVIRRYDHEVQGATVIKPLVGLASDGPSDAVVLRPLVTEGWQGVAIGCGINPHYGHVDPYAMAWAVVDEAMRNVVCVGADPDRVALLDNFCWGSPAFPDRLGSLVRAAQGCHDAALAFGTPFISGKDSLNNEYVDAQGEKRTIPPTLMISSLGIVPDIRQAITMDLKEAGNLVYIVGETRAELGASLHNRLYGALGNGVPAPVPGARVITRAIHQALRQGLVCAIHDLSEGGLAVAAAEMSIAGRLGLELNLADMPRSADVEKDACALFAESSSRFLVEVSPESASAFEQVVGDSAYACTGRVTADKTLRISGLKGDMAVECSIETLRQAWQSATIV
jgi:phosphoribosylformylglycinamidine synthase II